MNDLYRQAVSLSFFAKGAAATVGVLIIHAAFRVLEKTLPQRFGRADARYKVRKLIVFSGYFSILLFLAILFEDRLGRLSFAIGVVGAGVAVVCGNRNCCRLARMNPFRGIRRRHGI
jgi:chromate transport protein ChrA